MTPQYQILKTYKSLKSAFRNWTNQTNDTSWKILKLDESGNKIVELSRCFNEYGVFIYSYNDEDRSFTEITTEMKGGRFETESKANECFIRVAKTLKEKTEALEVL